MESGYISGVRVLMRYYFKDVGESCFGSLGVLVCLIAYISLSVSFIFLGISVYWGLLYDSFIPTVVQMLVLFSLYISSMVLAGIFVDLFGGEKLLIVFLLLFTSLTLAIAVIYFSENLMLNFIAVLLTCTSAWFPIVLGSYIHDYIDISCRGTVYGFGAGIGSLVAFIFYNLAHMLSLRVVMALLGVVAALAGVIALIAIEKEAKFKRRVFNPAQILYRKILSVSLSIFIFYAIAGFATIKLYPILEKFSPGIMAYTVSVPYLIFIIVAGILLDSVGRKPVGVIGFIILSIGNTILALCEEHHSIFLSTIIPLIIIRVAYSFIDAYVVTMLIDLAGRRSKGFSIAIGLIAMSSGVLLGSILAGVVKASRLGIIMGTLLLIASIYMVLRIPETLPKKIKKDEILEYIDRAKKIAGKE